MRLHYYNPECDLALALDKPNYTAPVTIVQMQKRDALIPVQYAAPDDLLLLPEGVTPADLSCHELFETALKHRIRLVTFDSLASFDYTDIQITPWGWSRALRHKLLKHGVPENALPDQHYLDKVRSLSHRRTTITANKDRAFDKIRDLMPPLPLEFDNVEKAMQWADTQTDLFFKAPWSSSGHGIFHLSQRHTPPQYYAGKRKLAIEWLTGTISRQESVLAEVGLERYMDCASEWYADIDGIYMVGLSAFEADENGHYLGNIKQGQYDIQRRIEQALKHCSGQDGLLEKILECQRSMLRHIIMPNYVGPLGVDMIITKDGKIAPCVEINLRMTQGYAIVYREQ